MIHNIMNKSYHNIIKLCVNLCNFVVIVLYDHDTYTLSVPRISGKKIFAEMTNIVYIYIANIFFSIFSCRKGAVVTKY